MARMAWPAQGDWHTGCRDQPLGAHRPEFYDQLIADERGPCVWDT